MSRLRKKRTATLLIAMFVTSMFTAAVSVRAADPTTIDSSTMEFEGALTLDDSGEYHGVIPMIVDGGYDIYAKEGASAWFGDDPGTGEVWTSVTISDHDGWPTWDPDTPDWYQYSLELTQDGRWAIRNHPGATAAHPWYEPGYERPPKGVPMSGTMDWDSLYAKETDVGAYIAGTGTPEIPGGAESKGGGVACWDMDWSWGSEVVPLEYPGFDVTVEETETSGTYHVTMTPSPHEPQLEPKCAKKGWDHWVWIEYEWRSEGWGDYVTWSVYAYDCSGNPPRAPPQDWYKGMLLAYAPEPDWGLWSENYAGTFEIKGKTLQFDEEYVPTVDADPQINHVVLHLTGTTAEGDSVYTGKDTTYWTSPSRSDYVFMDVNMYEIHVDESGQVVDYYYEEHEYYQYTGE